MRQPERTVLVATATMAVVVALHWIAVQIGALAHTGDRMRADLATTVGATARLVTHMADPAHAWPANLAARLPGPAGYWGSVAAVFIAAALASAVASRRLHALARVTERRTRLGVDTSARLATARDMRPLIVRRPIPGRFILGRVGRHLIATESPAPRRRRMRRGSGVGDRTSVAIIGPTRCGKTAAAISGILDWSGPAVLSSVKSDLMAATIGWRRTLGEVRVFDPTCSTNEPSCGWSPLRAAGTISGAQKAARGLVDAGPRAGADNLDFWLRLAEQTLWPHLYLAAHHRRTMGHVTRWITTQESPEDPSTELATLAIKGLDDPDPAIARDTRLARDGLLGLWNLDRRTRSSAYATAQTLIGPWNDPDVARTSLTHDVDLEWLLNGDNTLYLCGPLHEQARLAPVFGGLLGDLIHQVYEHVTQTDRAITPTLFVLDEAANTPTRWLPETASTCAGLGVLLVTIWQAKAQLDAAYGRRADTVLTNHGTKVIFSGTSDLATLDYASRLLSDEDTRHSSTTIDESTGHRSRAESRQRLPLLPSHVLRQTRPGTALLIHGDLPPAHLKSRPYYREPSLRARVS